MSIKRIFHPFLKILSAFILLIVCFTLFTFSASAGPIRDRIHRVGESAASSLSPFDSPSIASDSVLSEESAILSGTSDILLLSKYNQAKELLYTRHFSEAEELFISLVDFADSRELASLCRSYSASEISKECGVIVHDLSAVGSSSGCYTALNAAASLYDAFGVRLTNVCSMDASTDWNSWALLTDAEMDSVASAGTIFYLFEQHSTKPETPAIQDMISHGIDVWLITCSSANHSAISKNAFLYGIFSWSGGEDITLPSSEYVFNHLTPEIKKPFVSPVDPISPLPFGKDDSTLNAG